MAIKTNIIESPTKDDLIHKRQPHVKLYKSDVWGKFDDNYKNIDNGMIVARGYPDVDEVYFTQKDYEELIKNLPHRCPVWKDKLPYKSVTAICEEKDLNDVIHWLSYVHGGEYEKTKKLPSGKIAIRSNYQAW